MSFQPKQNNKDLSLSQEMQTSEPHAEFDETASSSQLENILGRINAIMTDGSPNELLAQKENDQTTLHSAQSAVNSSQFSSSQPEMQFSEQPNDLSDLNSQTNSLQTNKVENQQAARATTDNSVHASQQNLEDRLSQTANVSGAEKEDKFQVSEPLDMLQPYSEVLNEVRDYFNERHSLDPNDSLAKSQRSQSISEEVLAGSPLQEELKKPKKVLLWGDAPLDPHPLNTQSSEIAGSPLQNVRDEEGKVNGAASASDLSSTLSPADFGFGQSQETQPLETQFLGTRSSLANEVSQGEDRNMLGQPSQIFSPIKFENPFARSHTSVSSVDVLGPDEHSGQFKQLRHELVDRIAQLEQVIGHHFGDRKEIANEAAHAAMTLAIKNLDDTALGRRLADVETAFILYQKNQTQKNQETQETIEKLGQALLKMESVSQISAEKTDQQKLDKQNVPLASSQSNVDERDGEHSVAKAVAYSTTENSTSENKVTHSGVENKKQNVTVGDKISRPGEYRVDEIQVPTDKKESPGSVNGKTDLSSRITNMQPSIDETPPLLSPEALESFDKDTGETVSKEGDVDAIAKLRQAMSKSASERSFGKPEKETGLDNMSARMSASPSNEKLDPNHSAIQDEGFAGDQGHVRGDDFLAKSATLRDQFNSADIVSNDSDLHTMQPRGLRVVVIIVVIALLLAATGIAFRGDTKGFQAAIYNIVTTVKSVLWQDSSLKKAAKTTSQPVENNKEQKDLNGKLLDKNKSNDRLGTLMKNSETSSPILGKEPEITGNIGETGVKQDQSLEPSLLDGGGVKLGMPPALIGPYSLRLAASRGDVRAEYEVARRFSYGLGVPKDPEQAVKWYMQGASKGFAPSQYRLATYYERGRGIEKNLGRAKVWYQRAAMLGNVKAMHNLAVISTALDKEDTDYKAAIYWFKQAANRNLADSQFNLAILYQNGVGLSKNNLEAYKWFSLAARQGDVDAASRRDLLEKKLKKDELLEASKLLQNWRALTIDSKANDVGRISSHITSTMSHAHETVSRSRVLTAQILLRKLGYGLKNADGAMNEETIRAVKKFEKAKGLPITGKISPDLIQKLNKASL